MSVGTTDSVDINRMQVIKPNLVTLHPIALFSMRKLNNFKSRPDKFSISAHYSMGNIMLPKVDIYYPIKSDDLNFLKELPWHWRQPEGIESEIETLEVDGLFRNLNLDFNVELAECHELNLTLRTLYFEAGSQPFTFFNSDAFIEWFHSNIHGGDDPFARKVYGYDKAKFFYRNRKGEELTLNKNDFIVPGVEMSYYYYPKCETLRLKNINSNFGFHLGVNTSAFNNSLDLGGAYSISKYWQLGAHRYLSFSLGTTLIYYQLLKKASASHVFFNNFNGLAEGVLEYKWKHKLKNRMSSFAFDYVVQTPYRLGYSYHNDYNGLIFDGLRNTSHWHLTGTHLFRENQFWSLIYSYYVNSFVLSVYLQEDRVVNNAPDTQTGISFKWCFQ